MSCIPIAVVVVLGKVFGVGVNTCVVSVMVTEILLHSDLEISCLIPIEVELIVLVRFFS
jgi:hypothetical protein